MQVHAVLGIAELSEDQAIDPWLVQQIAPTARAHVIAQGLDDGLFHKEQIEILLKWPLLETAPRLLLLADLQRIDNSSNTEVLKELSNNTDLSVAMFAAILSDDTKTIENTRKNMACKWLILKGFSGGLTIAAIACIMIMRNRDKLTGVITTSSRLETE